MRVLIGERERRLYPLAPESIDYIESNGNYVTLHLHRTTYISRDSIKRLSASLADYGFIRIHRFLLVNIRSVSYAERAGRGAYTFTLFSGSCLHSSATFRRGILRSLPLAPMPMGDPVPMGDPLL